MASNTTQAVGSGDLVDLVSSSGAATIYPSDDAILSVLQARFRADLPYTRVGSTNLVVVNPYKTLANVNDASARDYETRCYKDASIPTLDSPKPLQPHPYDLAARVYLLMRRRQMSQAVFTRGITSSGKSASIRLLMEQILRISTPSVKEGEVAEQVKAMSTVLDSFGNAKTLMNPNASRHYRYLELHFNEDGRISSAKVLTFGLDKSRLNRLAHEERTFHVFYQFLAGATSAERDALNIEDPSDYALLASSNTYRLPFGPFSDDSIAMSELRTAMRTLGFKAKSISSIFSLLFAILLLSNIEFYEGDHHDFSASIANPAILDQVARLLGIGSEELGQAVTNKTNYVRKEMYTVLLNAAQASAQRDRLMRDLYSILFAFVVETINHKVAPGSKDPAPHSQIILFDQPGFQSRGPSGTSSMALSNAPLLSAYGQNGFDEFCMNFVDEVLQSHIVNHVFDDTTGYNGAIVADGVSLPSISTMDNSACVELMRGGQPGLKAPRKPGGILGLLDKAASVFRSGKSGESRNEDLQQDLVTKFEVHAAFVASPDVGGAADRKLFGINHYAGPCHYEVSDFIEKDADVLDAAFVNLLKFSVEPLVSKLFKGPSLAVERHSKDENIIVQSQVSSRPLRTLTPVSPDVDSSTALDPGKPYPVTTQLNAVLGDILANIEQTQLWTIFCIRPNDSGSPNSFDKRRVKHQVRSLLLPDLSSRRSVEYVADYPIQEFCDRYVPRMQGSEEQRITQCARANGWNEGADFAVGKKSVWLSYGAWKTVEDQIRSAELEAEGSSAERDGVQADTGGDDETEYTYHTGQVPANHFESDENLMGPSYGGGGLSAPNTPKGNGHDRNAWDDEYEHKTGGMDTPPTLQNTESKEGGDLVVRDAPNAVEEVPSSGGRRVWLGMTWTLTWWIPSFVLKTVGRMKRPDVRLAWREKVAIFVLIFLFNCVVIFFIVGLGLLLCPDMDKAWKTTEVSQHTADNDYYVAIRGSVYDVTDFVRGDHSHISGRPSNTRDNLEQLAGQDLTGYFPIPLTLGCPDLVQDRTLALTSANFTPVVPTAMHTSGALQSDTGNLHKDDWYTADFLPTIKEYRKGDLVYEFKDLEGAANEEESKKYWATWRDGVYDLSDYWNSIDTYSTEDKYKFLNEDLALLFQQQSGKDVTEDIERILGNMDDGIRERNIYCLKNVFYVGRMDFRVSARCQTQKYLLIVFSAIIMSSMVLKFLSALQFGSKQNPELQDKFVLCQVPCYTEGEDSLKRTLNSLTALNYDDKRKLIFVICDGNIIGSGNDRTTPQIVLDILGVDSDLDPEPLLFKSVGEGSRALNYGKVYSGLYEHEGHVVPYMVVVKVGKPTERSKPGNRGKRDSQILLMHYLNRVHFDAAMSPLELEIYHQMRNVIGIDPAFYEYIFTVDADTTVTPESLNRLVACAADDSSVIGICGETKLDNEEGSWWTMIQVYEYYLSHHLAKAFESLFGSVTCLPGCFSLYRIRTSDKGRPVIISNRVIDEYADPNVDTLHKKNLFSLGEDRFLTTLLMKHFPTFKTRFCADAIAHTIAPESVRVLFSQRRRWINSTVHNLCELVLLPELFGFCCFSMRFFVFIDLLGTIILPSTFVYIVYLIVTIATGSGVIPVIAIVMIALVYGLQALIFILKREFMLIGWMVVYILSYPVHSFFLPIYSFWCMDEFGWGNTRLVIGEGKDKKVIVNDDDKFDESMIPLKKFSEYEAEAWEQGSQHSYETGYSKPKSHSKPLRSRDHSPSYQQASQTGDYYRDTNLMTSYSNSNLHKGSQASLSNLSHNQPPMSAYGTTMPQLPFMPFAGGPGSVAGSDYGGMPQMPPLGFQNTGSMYGMMPGPGAPRNTVMSNFGMMNTGHFGGSQSGMMPMHTGAFAGSEAGPQRMSTFSLATTANPFMGPSQNPEPADDELFQALRNYLSTQDLMTVTKKSAREAIAQHYPKADLTSRKDFLNKSIDSILSES